MDFIIVVKVADMQTNITKFFSSLMKTTYKKKNFQVVFLAEYDGFMTKGKIIHSIDWELSQVQWKEFGLSRLESKDIYEIWSIPNPDGNEWALIEALKTIYKCPIIIEDGSFNFVEKWYDHIR